MLFKAWMDKITEPSNKEVFNFHLNKQGYKPNADEWRERGNWLKTVSITQVVDTNSSLEMIYKDLVTGNSHTNLVPYKIKNYG